MDETYEQFEERVLNKRAAHMYHVIKSKLDTKDKLTLSEMAFKNNRKQVSSLRNYTQCCVTLESYLSHFIFIGCAEILYTVGAEEVSSTRTSSRIFICRNYSHKRTKIRKPCIIKVFNPNYIISNTNEDEENLIYAENIKNNNYSCFLSFLFHQSKS